jgi:membrane protein implicated in regulation of membrane protease activity
MLALYLFCLIVGGGLLLFSALAPVDSEAAGAHDAPDHALHAEGTPATEFFSVRVLLYFLAGFGATGSLIQLLIDAPNAVSLGWAIGTGVVAAASSAAVYGWLRRTESGLVPLGADHLVGLQARVVLPVEVGRRGKVVAVHDGREIELLARLFTPEDAACPRGSVVVIVDIDGETALVTPASFLPSDPA